MYRRKVRRMGKISAEGVKRYCKWMFDAKAIYLWGADVEVLTSELLESLKKRFGTKHYEKISIENNEGKIGADCSGFLRPLSGHDNTAAGYYKECTKRGDISKMPKDKMCLVFRKQEGIIVHVGIYMGDGTTYEMYNGCEYKKFSSTKWDSYGIPEWIEQTKKALAVGDKVTLEEEVNGYRTAKDAENKTNVVHKVVPGDYYVYKLYGKAVNISRYKNSPGSWVVL